jgi:uncharacterized protein
MDRVRRSENEEENKMRKTTRVVMISIAAISMIASAGWTQSTAGFEAFQLVDCRGFPEILLAARQGDTVSIGAFLDAGVYVDAEDESSGMTALMEAADYGRIDVVRLLIQRGANPKARNRLGTTAQEIAQARGHAELARLIETAYLSIRK